MFHLTVQLAGRSGHRSPPAWRSYSPPRPSGRRRPPLTRRAPQAARAAKTRARATCCRLAPPLSWLASAVARGPPPVSGLLRPLGTVLRPGLLAILDALQVERGAHYVVAPARQVLDPAAANQHHRVFLQIVSFAADVRDHLETVGQAHLGHLAKRRVRLLGRGGVDTRADAATLRAVLQRRALALRDRGLATLANELVDGRHLV